MKRRVLIPTVTLLAVWLAAGLAWSQSPKRGGVLNVVLYEDPPQGFAVHEASVPSTVVPAQPCLSNLVLFDPLKSAERADTIVGELAERWSWQDNYQKLVFFLRKNVRWHDGQPFTAKDVKYTFDLVREAKDAPARLRINPRREWYANVKEIEAVDPWTVVFKLRRPQPALLMMLATGYAPIYPMHLPAANFRHQCVGTGPFKLKEWRRGEFVEYVRNPEYFVSGRPFLDGIKFIVIVARGTQMAALRARRVDMAFPGYTSKPIGEELKAAVPELVLSPFNTNINDNLLINLQRPPLDKPNVRRALSYAVDRHAFVKAVRQGGAVVGAALMPRPQGEWGLTAAELAAVPGYGPPDHDKAKARQLLREAGFGPANPLRLEIATRALNLYVEAAAFVAAELRQVGVETTLKQVESAQWFPLLTRREYQIAANLTANGSDDPDTNFYDNYACDSTRNYSGYCDQEVQRLIDQQSQELDQNARARTVLQIQRKLEDEAVRPTMAWRLDYFAHWPYVKQAIPHQNVINWARMQEVWLDR